MPLVHCAEAKHTACGTSVTVKSTPQVNGVPGYLDKWCPKCKRFIPSDELDLKGPYVLVTEATEYSR